MKLLVLVTLASVASAAPQAPARAAAPTPDVQLLRFDSNNDGLGTYNYAFEQSDGHKREEAGELRHAGADDEHASVRGSYSWRGPDGVVYTVTYTADDRGFRPTVDQGPGGAVPAGVVASLLG